MRLGLLGDIHGNAAALSAVLEKAQALEVEALCLTGDFVGYYHDPKKVLDLIALWDYWAVRGNHEDMLSEALADSQKAELCRKKYGSGVDRAVAELGESQLAFLDRLPVSLDIQLGGCSVLLAHGTPWSTDAYLYPDSDEALWHRVAECTADYIVLGHTHYQMTRSVNGKQIINPGSVGQPRDRVPGAAWTILDTESGKIEHRRESYDIAALTERTKVLDPELPYLWNVLTRT